MIIKTCICNKYFLVFSGLNVQHGAYFTWIQKHTKGKIRIYTLYIFFYYFSARFVYLILHTQMFSFIIRHICLLCERALGQICAVIGREESCCKVIGGQLGFAHAVHAGTEPESHIWSCAPIGGAALVMMSCVRACPLGFSSPCRFELNK